MARALHRTLQTRNFSLKFHQRNSIGGVHAILTVDDDLEFLRLSHLRHRAVDSLGDGNLISSRHHERTRGTFVEWIFAFRIRRRRQGGRGITQIPGHALNAGLNLRGRMRGEIHRAHRGLEMAFVVFYLENFAALHAFDENLDVAILQLQTLHDIDDGADLVDLVRLGLVNAGVVLGGQKDLLVGSQRCFQGAHAGFPAHHEWGHHEREDHHVPYGHHGQLFAFEFFGHRILFLSKGYHAWQVALMRQRGDLDRYFGYWLGAGCNITVC